MFLLCITECSIILSSTDTMLILDVVVIYVNNIKQCRFLMCGLLTPKQHRWLGRADLFLFCHLDHWFYLGAQVPKMGFLFFINQVKTRSHRCICVSFQIFKGHSSWCLEEVNCPCPVGIALCTTYPISSSI